VSDFSAILLSQLDEDERIAREALRVDGVIWKHVAFGEPMSASAAHGYRHDPARVLRFVTAARAILAAHEPLRVNDGWVCTESFDGITGESYPCTTVRALSSIYGLTDE
jgi:hypothetical protein